jgi:hypothetical protein
MESQIKFQDMATLIDNSAMVAINCLKQHADATSEAYAKIEENNVKIKELQSWFKQQKEAVEAAKASDV